MKKILVPIDFSENADRALAAAKLVADQESTQLLILHAYQPYIPDMTVPSAVGVPPISPETEEAFQHRLDEYVAETRQQGYQAEGIWAIGGIHPSVFEAIEQHQPDLVVLGRTGTGGFLDKLIGSSATRIALDAPCPVLVVPPYALPKAFKEVVYATQLEYDENHIIRRVLPIVNRLGARLTFLKVDSSTQPNIQPDQQYIHQIQTEFAIPTQDFVLREADSVRAGIEAYCDEVQADLLIMASRERGFIEAFITNPSVTKKLVVDTHIPLLVFHIRD
ncbi:universal stress protein [Rhabdobacter roseus]|uniref:Nucleotide-binding universal stress UspA family protein n=1 Tax=Rhabdobacter roseus TaxID=1655419 RepID=A0A840U1U5_9BACT|nr:universal stress protein [Rhabdobacter roseus]MBB5286338.1 nucleotide-binding universal stress UspA family protein [Rhabdobacter roseus]